MKIMSDDDLHLEREGDGEKKWGKVGKKKRETKKKNGLEGRCFAATLSNSM